MLVKLNDCKVLTKAGTRCRRVSQTFSASLVKSKPPWLYAEEHIHVCSDRVTECIVCVQGHDPLTFSFLSSFLFFDRAGVLWP